MEKGNMKRCDVTIRQKCDRLEERNAKQRVKKRPVLTTEERRRMANERERIRVHALSAAFDNLRRVIPSYSSQQKLSKLSVLRVAINYISALGVINTSEERFSNVVLFRQYVRECTITLQSEYGKSKNATKLCQETALTKLSCKWKRTPGKRGSFLIN